MIKNVHFNVYIYNKEKIIVEKGRLYKLIQQQQSRSNREERLIEIANRVL